MHQQLFVVALAASIATAAFGHGEETHKPAASHDHSSKGHEQAGGKETAVGRPGAPAKVDRTIAVEMRDPAEFFPADSAVMPGETGRFVGVNAGKHEHEMGLGSVEG